LRHVTAALVSLVQKWGKDDDDDDDDDDSSWVFLVMVVGLSKMRRLSNR